MIKATKKVGDKTITHEFTPTFWENLPKHKEGWVAVEKEAIVEPDAVKKARAEAEAKAK